MDERKRRRVDLAQNLLIFALSVSALLLLAWTQRLTWTGDTGLSRLFPSNLPEAVAPSELASLPMPVKLVITGAYGRFGDLFAVTTEEAFAEPGGLLREALGSAGEPKPCGEADFRAALAEESVYYDFQTVLPLSVIAGLVGGDAPAEYSARRLLLASEGETSALYFTNGEVYYRCAAKTAATDLRELAGGYQLSGAAFAYELEQDALEPYTLFLTEELPACPVLSARDLSGDVDGLLTALGFNPGTRDRYTESTGTLVVREGERTLRVQTDGTAVYDSGGTTDLRIAGGEASPSLDKAIMGGYQFFSRLLPDSGAALCLRSALRQDGNWVLTFDCQYDGVLIRRGGGGAALTVGLEGGSIAWFSLYLRSYSAGEENSRLLPLVQALAIARRYQGKELNIRYIDAGASSVSGNWLAE